MASFPTAQLMLRLGPLVPLPAPAFLVEALESVEVSQSDEGRSGFQLVFRAGRSARDLVDSPVLVAPQLTVFSRVRIILVLSGIAYVLMDGVITHQQYAPSVQPGASTFTVTGEDISLMMDQVELQEEYPSTTMASRVETILGRYKKYGVVPVIVPLVWDTAEPAEEKVPTQQGTDLDYLSSMAAEVGCVFFIVPGPIEGKSIGYFGPPIRIGVAQRALTWNMGAATNLASISFEHDATKPVLIDSWFPADPEALPILTSTSSRKPLSRFPTLITHLGSVHKKLGPSSETSYSTALSKAMEETNKSTDAVVTASGEVDVFRYGSLLYARALVDVRGVGYSYDGNWYVKSVTHSLKKGEYRQKFSLQRDGLGSILPWATP